MNMYTPTKRKRERERGTKQGEVRVIGNRWETKKEWETKRRQRVEK